MANEEVTEEELEEKGIFEVMFNASKEMLKKLTKSSVRRGLKRKIESAYDDAEDQKSMAEVEIFEIYKDLESYDINKVIAKRQLISAIEDAQKEFKKEYMRVFKEELVIKG